MQPPPRPADWVYVKNLAKGITTEPGQSTPKVRKALLKLSYQDWKDLESLDIPAEERTSGKETYATAIVHDLSIWRTGRDHVTKRTATNPLVSYYRLSRLVEHLAAVQHPHSQFLRWEETFATSIARTGAGRSDMESLRTALSSLGREACGILARKPAPNSLYVTHTQNGAHYILGQWSTVERATSYREMVTAMLRIGSFCFKTLRERHQFFMMLSMEYQRAKINHINYLDILNLLHAIGGSDVFPELILTVKLSIATLTPHQIDLYYKTYTKDGKNCGRRLEEEVRELAQHVRDDEDVKIEYDWVEIKELGERALPGRTWYDHWDSWGRRLGLASDFLYYRYTPSPEPESPYAPGDRNQR